MNSKWVTAQPGAYLVAGVGGMEGVIVYPPAQEHMEDVA